MPGPPYTDDPGCKYIVIEDPWPGNMSGKARRNRFYNHLLGWVRFMLGRVYDAECLYYMSKRDEVIVQLPRDVDIVPILGAHAWKRFLSKGDVNDRERISYVFEYDYRNKGEPGNHNWTEFFPTAHGDPPPHIGFPVMVDYPRPGKASPRGRKCGDIALPLPSTWRPPPDTSAFTQYQRPSLLTDNTVNNANAVGNAGGVVRRDGDDSAQTIQQERSDASTSKMFGKIDPYEEERMSLQSLKLGPEDFKPDIKQESATVRVKTERVKHEDAPYVPSATMVAAFEEARRSEQGPSIAVPPSDDQKPTVNGHVKLENDPPAGPSDALITAFYNLRREQVPEPYAQESSVVKSESEVPYSRSSTHLVGASRDARSPAQPDAEWVSVKPDPHLEEVRSEPATTKDSRVKREPTQHVQHGPSAELIETQASLKRVHDQDRDGALKRVKTEHTGMFKQPRESGVKSFR